MALRQLPGHIPVVFMSSGLRLRDAVAQQPVEGTLEKPFHVEELLRLVARFCG